MSTVRKVKLGYNNSTVSFSWLAYVYVIAVFREGVQQKKVDTDGEQNTTPRGVYHDAGAGSLKFGVPGQGSGLNFENVTI